MKLVPNFILTSYHQQRKGIADRMTALKKKQVKSKPMGVQLDSCKQALERAKKRRANCEEIILAAQATEHEAVQERMRLEAELLSRASTVGKESQVS